MQGPTADIEHLAPFHPSLLISVDDIRSSSPAANYDDIAQHNYPQELGDDDFIPIPSVSPLEKLRNIVSLDQTLVEVDSWCVTADSTKEIIDVDSEDIQPITKNVQSKKPRKSFLSDNLGSYWQSLSSKREGDIFLESFPSDKGSVMTKDTLRKHEATKFGLSTTARRGAKKIKFCSLQNLQAAKVTTITDFIGSSKNSISDATKEHFNNIPGLKRLVIDQSAYKKVSNDTKLDMIYTTEKLDSSIADTRDVDTTTAFIFSCESIQIERVKDWKTELISNLQFLCTLTHKIHKFTLITDIDTDLPDSLMKRQNKNKSNTRKFFIDLKDEITKCGSLSFLTIKNLGEGGFGYVIYILIFSKTCR